MKTAVPSRRGVGASTYVLPNINNPPALLLTHLQAVMPLPGGQTWQQRFADKLVLGSDTRALGLNEPYCAGKKIYYYRDLPDEESIRAVESIVFEDEHLLVADKPHFLPVTPSGAFLRETLLVRLKVRTGCADLVPLHRLDRDTAGVVLFSKTRQWRAQYVNLFRQRQIEKVYLAIAGPLNTPLSCGGFIDYQSHLESVPHSFMQMRENPDLPANSFTRISLLEQQQQRHLYQLQPRSGKRHQLRAQMNALGAPIEADQIYPVLTPEVTADLFDYANPLQLLAKEIAFADPVNGQIRRFFSRFTLRWSSN
jgi:tRNA pseudouridine32 synthase / 23S rRNA pseudouridine746 synthase